jgi:rSAM/selenodomain-associated transferase 2/rSAM/selenodomain-associated transferase 1
MTMRPDQIILFGRYPLPGRAKKRLIPQLGALRAAGLQRKMTLACLAAAEEAQDESCGLDIVYTDGSEMQMRRWLGAKADYIRQSGGDLGCRMLAAFAGAFDRQAARVVLIGTDCPELTAVDIRAAFDALENNDLVLGPSADGGYWLIAMRRMLDVFRSVAWGGPDVLAQTLGIAERAGVSTGLLDMHHDIDTPDDLEHLDDRFEPGRPYLSVIIPALNEAERIGDAIASAYCDGVEVIVADGSSNDETADIARQCGAKVITAPPGRAKQMNAGADVASGKVLCFLHADTILPSGFAEAIFEAMSNQKTIAGAFRYQSDIASKLFHRIVHIRSSNFSLPYGDQAIFIRKSDFESAGPFPDVPLAEDLFFVRRLKRLGRIVTLDLPAVTSPRRRLSEGPWKNTLTNAAILAACYLGASPETVSRFRK